MRTPSIPRSPRALAFPAAFLLGLALAGPLQAQGSWQILAQPTEHDLRKLAFIDATHGWVAGDAGTVLHTEDGGVTWTRQSLPSDIDLVDVRVIDSQHGWALGQVRGSTDADHKSAVFRTQDGGKSWAMVSEFNALFNALDFVDALNGSLVGHEGVILRTLDGGLTWETPRIESQETALWTIRSIEFLTPEFGIAMGGDYDVTGVVWRTFDGGASWTHMRVAGEPVFAVHAFDPDNLLCVGGDLDYGAGMVRSDRRGDAWDFTDLRIWGQAQALAFRDPYVGWSPLGVAGTAMFTNDSGQTWTAVMTPEGLAMFDVAFPGPDAGFMVGESGTVLGWVPGGSTGVSPAASDRGTVLLQNTPNPFRPKTEFGFSLGVKGHVTLKVYDTGGREVATIVNGDLEAGSYKMPFDAGNLSSGVYYYKLSTRNFTDTKKMVVLR